MCGICVNLIFNSGNSDSCTDQRELTLKLQRRGPNSSQQIKRIYKSLLELNFISSVLHLRGDSLEQQPIQDEKNNILLWNGEIFDGPLYQCFQSDTKLLSNKLCTCSESKDILDTFASIQGPYAFVYYQSHNDLLWFGRDIFGRRSLMWSINSETFYLCSLAYGLNDWQEVPTTGLFCLNLKNSYEKKSFTMHHFPWSTSASGSSLKDKLTGTPNSNVHLCNELDFTIQNPIVKPLNRTLPSVSKIKNYMKVSVEENILDETLFSLILKDEEFRNTLAEFEVVFSQAVEKRVQNHLYLCKNCYSLNSSKLSVVNCNHSSIGILFSGGLDSIVIAALAHRHIPENLSIDLLNVAFASTAKIKVGKNSAKENAIFDTPDRITGRSGSFILKGLYPTRTWNFVEINISEEELVLQRKISISQLLKPSCTVLDDSIGCAIWFAARRIGSVISNDGYKNYESPARVLLVGMGADEQFGGYSRHRAKFKNFGWSGVIDELAMELDRIGSRNLGRDDRIISDHGVESRYPFLDENLVSFLNDLPVSLKMDLNLPRGIGEKLLLRLLAFKMGLKEAAVLPKRAIQFGSRIARIENTKEKGSDICERLQKSL